MAMIMIIFVFFYLTFTLGSTFLKTVPLLISERRSLGSCLGRSSSGGASTCSVFFIFGKGGGGRI